MSKECVWIHTESDEVVPKLFVESHTDNKCVSITKIEQIKKELKELTNPCMKCGAVQCSVCFTDIEEVFERVLNPKPSLYDLFVCNRCRKKAKDCECIKTPVEDELSFEEFMKVAYPEIKLTELHLKSYSDMMNNKGRIILSSNRKSGKSYWIKFMREYMDETNQWKKEYESPIDEQLGETESGVPTGASYVPPNDKIFNENFPSIKNISWNSPNKVTGVVSTTEIYETCRDNKRIRDAIIKAFEMGSLTSREEIKIKLLQELRL